MERGVETERPRVWGDRHWGWGDSGSREMGGRNLGRARSLERPARGPCRPREDRDLGRRGAADEVFAAADWLSSFITRFVVD